MFFRKLSTFICPILIFLSLEFLLYNINLIYIILVVPIIILLFFLKLLIKEKFFSRNFFYFSVLPLLFLLLVIGFLLLLAPGLHRHLVIVIFSLISGVYLDNLFSFYYRPSQYLPNTLENLSSFLNLLVFFLVSVNLNAFNVFLSMPIWLESFVLVLITSFLIGQTFWINKIESNFKIIYLLIIDIITLEFFWSLFFLPTNFYVNSIILTIIFYITLGLIMAKLNDKLEKKIIWRYLIISFILLFFIIFTSPWI